MLSFLPQSNRHEAEAFTTIPLHKFDKRVIASSNQHIFLTSPPTVNKNGRRRSSDQQSTLKNNPRNPKLSSFSNKKYLNKFTRIVCSAVEDATSKKQELSSGSLKGADLVVEDRPGKIEPI
ncbi:sec-independent protein translocase protein TATC [Forsythia ovata]|uniref:Sec-independent protein translocase protein TATC n=1 Tax=Forsythia ovata TaxID=205694 RepID=A0ABD1WPB7_9LAMI